MGALAAVMADPMAAAKAGVWAHGAAAERAGARRVRGVLLSDVLEALGGVWHESVAPLSPGVLASLPAVGER
jgi:NAD(P)H-hydrate repair Nnr-like enzyme with NAD(P)H-hydrate dehydratase domain